MQASSFQICILWRKSVFALDIFAEPLVASVKATVDGGGRFTIPHKSRRETQLINHTWKDWI